MLIQKSSFQSLIFHSVHFYVALVVFWLSVTRNKVKHLNHTCGAKGDIPRFLARFSTREN